MEKRGVVREKNKHKQKGGGGGEQKSRKNGVLRGGPAIVGEEEGRSGSGQEEGLGSCSGGAVNTGGIRRQIRDRKFMQVEQPKSKKPKKKERGRCFV